MRKWIVAVSVILVLLVGLYALTSSSGNADDYSGKIKRSGIIKPVEIKLGAQIFAEVAAIRVAEGDRIKKDDTAIQLDDTLLKDQLLAAASGVEVAKATLDAAKSNPGMSIAKAQLKHAEAELSAAQTQYALTVIKSPVDGIVKSIAFSKGEVVSPGTTVAVVAKTSELDLTVYVTEKDLARIKTGQNVDVLVDAYPGVIIEGRIVDVASGTPFILQADQAKDQLDNLIYGVKIRIDNPEGKLKPGMSAGAILD